MAIRTLPRVLVFALYTLVLLGAAFGISYGVFEWRDEDEPTTSTEQPEAPNGATEGEKSFSMTWKTADDFEEVVRQVGVFMPDFGCTGKWNEGPAKGTLDCSAGLTGFECDFVDSLTGWPRSVACREGEQPPEGFPTCTVERDPTRYLVRCSGPHTDTFCEIRKDALSVTCQRP
jgi:hypothetical protein